MKSFIKDKLRLVLEGRLSTHTPTNAKSEKIYRKNITQGMINSMLAKIANASKLYKENPIAFGMENDGDGMYVMMITDSGHLKGIPSPKGINLQSGVPEPAAGGRGLYLPMKAYRAGSHPEYDDADREGTAVGRSPFEIDVPTKVLHFMGKDIISFMKGDEGYDDGRGMDLAVDVGEKKLRSKVKADIVREMGRNLTQPELDELHSLNLNLPEVITYLKNNNSKPGTRTQFGRFYHGVVGKKTMQTRPEQTYDANVSDNMDMINDLLKQKARAKGDERREIIKQIETLRNS